MTTEDQHEVIRFLESPSTHGGLAVDRIDTHSAMVFLAGRRAYKLKRAVRFDYLDFSTVERRRAHCHAELRLNQRTAPTIYRRVLSVTREENGQLALDGAGPPVDWLVEMNRFDQAQLLDRLAAEGRLDGALMAPLADEIAAMHAVADRRFDHGGRAGMAWVIEGNHAGFAEFHEAFPPPASPARVTDLSWRALERVAAILDRRRDEGFVRQCHGDLHLRNIVLLDGRPTIFDGIEFNDRIACTDVLYDLALLLMDLWRQGLTRHANAVFNRYLATTDDLDGFAALPLFLSVRAAVRAKTSATAASLEPPGVRRDSRQALAREYLALAERLLNPPAPVLVAVGGLSGSGKSTLARDLAPTVGAVPGAVVIRSDEVRKRLLGVARTQALGPESYGPAVSDRVYGTLAMNARRVILGGHAAIVDAVHARPVDRLAVERVAATVSVPFAGLWLDAPEPLRLARVEARRGDVSDANALVVARQSAESTGPIGWHILDASAPMAELCQLARDRIRDRPREPENANAK